MRLYRALPVWAQHLAVSSYGAYWYWLRFGPGYREQLRAFARRDAFSHEAWRTWSRRRLAAVLRGAAREVPYYRRSWSRSQRRAAESGELLALPLLEKEPLRQDPHAFLRQDLHPLRSLDFATSGSTGTPITSIWTTAELRASLAIRELRSARWAGTSFRRRRATFSGRAIESDPDGPCYRWNAVEGQVYLSAFHLREESAARYVAALRRHRVEWLTGYAVSFHLLAQLMLEQGLEPPPLRAVITTSEALGPAMRETMARAYRCPIAEEYSCVENVLFASECEQGGLHLSPDMGHVEILRPDGSPAALGELGEVVATGLTRVYQTLIRYRLGDSARWAPEPCPCGRLLPCLLDVSGRLEDVVQGPDGRVLVRFPNLFTKQPHLREGQVIQEALDRLRLKVVTTAGFGPTDVADLERRVHEHLGPEVQVVVEPVSAIPRTAAGKFQAVISQLGKAR